MAQLRNIIVPPEKTPSANTLTGLPNKTSCVQTNFDNRLFCGFAFHYELGMLLTFHKFLLSRFSFGSWCKQRNSETQAESG